MQKKYKVEILPTAWEDLKKIKDYYLPPNQRYCVYIYHIADTQTEYTKLFI